MLTVQVYNSIKHLTWSDAVKIKAANYLQDQQAILQLLLEQRGQAFGLVVIGGFWTSWLTSLNNILGAYR